MEGVQVVGNSQSSVAFREQYSPRMSLEHGQRRNLRNKYSVPTGNSKMIELIELNELCCC